jgi:hypothetical protein
MSIEAKSVLPLLLEACPGFQSMWDAYWAYWSEDDPGPYLQAAEFAHFLAGCSLAGATDCFLAAFGTIERLLLDGDDEARALAAGGVLETLYVYSTNTLPDPAVFVAWLGPASLTTWQQILEVCTDKSSLAEVIRAERQSPDSDR